jgi:hypothetical protein
MPSPKSTAATRRKRATKEAPSVPTSQVGRLDAQGVDWLCEQIESGLSFRSIAASLDMNVSTLTRWAQRPENDAQVRAARLASAQTFDEMALDGILAAKTPLQLGVAKEAAHHLRWRASNVNPNQYGDKLRIDSTVSFANLTEEQLAKRAAEIEAKLRGEAEPTEGGAT